ncbi:MAG TPA: tRNA preQ1(34) S-adenosylmethionine ribosyltransferase-isomerase QueA [Candidatus Baltobacteraceae bacterium]|jgi:S-adenosylmethionine:tRNA ribosyltransferase-isomerase|nr:tRNA preQ1(34) S-adenosylmethionine ribosyltransferase-isomerase QueA [Candidatus Baltobacteraceae bacterium]
MTVDLDATQAYGYDLDPRLIASEPVTPADTSRLLVVGMNGELEHRKFFDFPSLLNPGDLLVLNETRVVRARLFGRRQPGGGKVELLLLRPADGSRFTPEARLWLALTRPARRLQPGTEILLDATARARVTACGDEGLRELEFDLAEPMDAFLERCGHVPLPPYIGVGNPTRADRYQTMFARVSGSVAAPTASLHFTDRTFSDLRARGVEIASIVLDIGLGTFRPIAHERIADHIMHEESFEIPATTADAVLRAQREGRRVIAAGTTVVRALESAALADGGVRSGVGCTNLFIRPGYLFSVVDGLLTNFHLPASTLLVLVCTFAGYERTMSAYRESIAQSYRFYSFGDAMFVGRCPHTTNT